MPLVVFPRSHIEAALFYANASQREVDINFMGRVHTRQEKANRARAWILDFVRRTFSPKSIYVDTTIDKSYFATELKSCPLVLALTRP